MNDSVIERVAREDPARRGPADVAWRRERDEATRGRVLAAIDRDGALVSRPARRGGGILRAGVVAVAMVARPRQW